MKMNVASWMVVVNNYVLIHLAASYAVVTEDTFFWKTIRHVKVWELMCIYFILIWYWFDSSELWTTRGTSEWKYTLWYANCWRNVQLLMWYDIHSQRVRESHLLSFSPVDWTAHNMWSPNVYWTPSPNEWFCGVPMLKRRRAFMQYCMCTWLQHYRA